VAYGEGENVTHLWAEKMQFVVGTNDTTRRWTTAATDDCCAYARPRRQHDLALQPLVKTVQCITATHLHL